LSCAAFSHSGHCPQPMRRAPTTAAMVPLSGFLRVAMDQTGRQRAPTRPETQSVRPARGSRGQISGGRWASGLSWGDMLPTHSTIQPIR
jgi:hypothetical protein